MSKGALQEVWPRVFKQESSRTTRDYEKLAEAIRTKLSLVEGVGKVLISHRDFRDQRDLVAAGCISRQDLETGSSKSIQINLWIVSRRSSADTKEAQEADTIIDTFILRGYLRMRKHNDTEVEFQQVVNNVEEAFRLHDTLGGLCETSHPAQTETIDFAMMAGLYLCHFAEIRLDVQHYSEGQ